MTLVLKTHTVTLDQCVIIIKNVPTMVCTQCGEVYFGDEAMQGIECIIDRLETVIKEVAIVDFSDAVA
ncbi:MAG: YgiT-type zinc finger protein [Clostridiales bacterium]|nr:YgiT-type zinc finger protein [Clostridiales bacterium]